MAEIDPVPAPDADKDIDKEKDKAENNVPAPPDDPSRKPPLYADKNKEV